MSHLSIFPLVRQSLPPTSPMLPEHRRTVCNFDSAQELQRLRSRIASIYSNQFAIASLRPVATAFSFVTAWATRTHGAWFARHAICTVFPVHTEQTRRAGRARGADRTGHAGEPGQSRLSRRSVRARPSWLTWCSLELLSTVTKRFCLRRN